MNQLEIKKREREKGSSLNLASCQKPVSSPNNIFKINYISMLKYFPKTNPASGLSPSQLNREKLGRFTRKPQTTSFVKKSSEGVIVTGSISAIKSTSRQKCRSQIEILSPHNSLKQLKTPYLPEIKFMSPKNSKDCSISSTVQNWKSQKSPKFTRTNQWDKNKWIKTSLTKQGNEDECQTDFTPKISHISLESVNHKDGPETNANTQDWLVLQRENQRLKDQNAKLKQQNGRYLKKIELLSDQKSLSRPQKTQRTGRCKNCLTMQQEIKLQSKYLKLFQITISEKQTQLGIIRNELQQTRIVNSKQRAKQDVLKEQLKEVRGQKSQIQRENAQLSRIIDSLKMKLGNHEKQLRYVGIKQNILLKKRHESQVSKGEIDKLNAQNLSLKQRVNLYKQKLDVVRILNKKKKVERVKSSKNMKTSDLFELSSQQSEQLY